MKYFFFISFILVFAACNNAGKDNDVPVNDSSTSVKKVTSSRFIYSFADTVLEQKIMDTLMKLPFVVKSNNYIDSFSNHQHGIAFIADTSAGKVTVMAGYNGPERFETYFNFTVDPKTFEIKVLNKEYDILRGEYISVEEYIKMNKE